MDGGVKSFCKGANEGESESVAGLVAALIAPIKAFKNTVEVFLWDAGPAVGDG